MKRLNIILFLFVILITAFNVKAQFISAEIGVNGLTCSACSRNVEMQIRKLYFVKDVQMNLENTTGVIIFKDSAAPDMDQIAKAIVNAGFSVRYLTAVFRFAPDATQPSENYCMTYHDAIYQFIKIGPYQLINPLTIKFIGREFLPKKEYLQWQDILKQACDTRGSYYFVTI